MATAVKTHQTKAIGWYAVRRVHIMDWLKPHKTRQTDPNGSNRAESSTNEGSTATKHKVSDEQTKDKTDSKSSENKKLLAKPSVDSKDAMKLKAVVRESHGILVKSEAVFPFQLFPDTINVDRHKLTIIYRQFWGIEQKVSAPIENIKNIEADLGPFFGTVTVTSDLFINNTQTVHFLWRDEAKKIQKLVQGMVVAQAEGINLNKIATKELRSMLIDLGSGHSRSM